jgi:hypothetical protein
VDHGEGVVERHQRHQLLPVRPDDTALPWGHWTVDRSPDPGRPRGVGRGMQPVQQLDLKA